MPSPSTCSLIRRTLFYEPAAREADGNEVPAVERITYQAFAVDGSPTTPVFSCVSEDEARRRAERHSPGVSIEVRDNRPAIRQAYRRHGREIPE